MKDYYETLGVKADATPQEIKRAFQKLAKKHHPDANQGAKKSEEKFKEISEAYETLSDVKRRQEYDDQRNFGGFGGFGGGGAGGAESGSTRGGGARRRPSPDAGGTPGAGGDPFGGFGGGGGVGTGMPDIDELLGRIFQGRGQAGSGPSGSPGGFADFGFEDLFGGGAGQRTQRQRSSGGASGGPSSQGGAKLKVPLRLALTGGRLQVSGAGTGPLQVEIPPGTLDGQTISVRTPQGTINLTIEIEPDEKYALKGRDICTELKINLAQALLGGKVKVRTLHGEELILTIPAGTQPDKTLRLKGQGMPGTPTGDLLVKLEVEIPEKLSHEAKELAESLAKACNLRH